MLARVVAWRERFGALGALSFFPSKNLGAAGDAGMVLSTDDSLGGRVRMLRTHGSVDRYVHERVGVNSRLDALQAAVLSVKLLRLDAWCEKRRERAAAYSRRFHDAGAPSAPGCGCPRRPRRPTYSIST